MSKFNLDKFRDTKFERRTKEVPVPELGLFFPKGSKSKVWIVQNLSGEELYAMRDAVDRNIDLEKTVRALATGQKADVVKDALGLTGKVPDDLARRLSVFVFGSAEPKIDRSDAVKFAQEYSLVFDRLTNEIMVLSGLGSKPGEKNGSGTTQK